MLKNLVVACADIGSTAKGNFGWWSSAGQEGTLPSTLAAHVASLLDREIPVALGFECPLFVPLDKNELRLTSARQNEGPRPWSAGAGCGALATGVVQVTWVLHQIRQLARRQHPTFLEWQAFAQSGGGLFLWEAFVSNRGKASGHVADARAGAEAFIDALPDPRSASAIHCDCEAISLAGLALLRTGWSSDPSILGSQCLVMKSADRT